MDSNKNENRSMEDMDNNIERLLKSALSPAPAAAFFKRGLLIHLKDELLRSTGGESRQQKSPDTFEENLSRLMAAAGAQDIQVEAKPGFKDRLRGEIITAGGATQRQRRLNVLSPALAATVVGIMLFMVFLFGIEIYPNYWADEGTEFAVNMTEGTGTVKEGRPLFFIWGTRTTKSSLDSGETAFLSAGDKITTGPVAKAVINLPNESTITLYSDSALDINDFDDANEQGVGSARVFLEKGTATSVINRMNYELATASTVAAVKGTAFQAKVISDDHTYLATSEGTVELTMNGETVEVTAGEEVNAIKGEMLEVKEANTPILELISPKDPEVYFPDMVLTMKTDAGAEVTVNDKPVPVNPDGTFSIDLILHPGPNTFVVIATNPAGKTNQAEQTYILI